MINPRRITEFDASKSRLQELIVFWILVAGKPARRIAPVWDQMLRRIRKETGYRLPFKALACYTEEQLVNMIKEYGIGCQSLKANALYTIVRRQIDLRTCTAEELERIRGIGRKTSHCFIMHTRRDTAYAGLDTHVLHFLNDLGFKVPRSTPGSDKQYKRVQSIFLNVVKAIGRTASEFDLLVWRVYSEHRHLSKRLVWAVRYAMAT